MAKLTWGAFGERYFETGIDRGVLYLQGRDGVAWSGLTSVRESPVGGKPTPYYIDGHKYANVATAEEYAATIEAFSAPLEFGVCDGTAEISPGLFLSEQPRRSFSFSYRTRIGNDLDGVDHGYKIHLVYNALAEPTSRAYATLDDSAEANSLSWNISTLPPRFPGRKPTAHLVIDSRRMSPVALTILEGYLYGADGITPRLPSPARIFSWLQEIEPPGQTVPWQDVRRPVDFKGSMSSEITELRNLVTNPRGRRTSGTVTIRENRIPNPVPDGLAHWGNSFVNLENLGDGWTRGTTTGDGTTYIQTVPFDQATVPVTGLGMAEVSIDVRVPSGGSLVHLELRIFQYDSSGELGTDYRYILHPRVPLQPGEETRLSGTFQPEVRDGGVGVRVLLYIRDEDQGYSPGNVLDFRHAYVGTPGDYFDGDTWDGDPDFTPEWTGTPGASTSRLVAPGVTGWTTLPGAQAYYSESRDAVAVRTTGAANHATAIVWSVGSYSQATALTELVDASTSEPRGMRARWDYNQTGWTDGVIAPATLRATETNVTGNLLALQVNLPEPGETFYVRSAAMEGVYDGPYFDGHHDTLTYMEQEHPVEWEGEPDASTSVARLLTTIPPNSHHGDIELINGDLYINQDGTFRNYGPIPEPPL